MEPRNVAQLSSMPIKVSTYAVGEAKDTVKLEKVFDDLVQQVADRNPDFYECVNGKLLKVNA